METYGKGEQPPAYPLALLYASPIFSGALPLGLLKYKAEIVGILIPHLHGNLSRGQVGRL